MTTHAHHPHKESFTIRTYDADQNGNVSIRAIANYFQEAASNHARAMGFPAERLLEQNLAWVLARLQIVIERLPYVGESVVVVTWPSSHERHMAYRCYELISEEGEPLARGTSAWVTVNLESRSMSPLPEFITTGYPQDNPPCLPFESRTLPRLKTPAKSVTLRTRKADLDINGHVNNVHYLEWATEPVCTSPDITIQYINISFRAECFAGKNLSSSIGQQGEDNCLLHSIRNEDDNKELCRVRTRWNGL
ncbi:acyl-[acyl-carrier-protein] thioesterase [Oleidesulfovibrio sp.]|uniref:acyl-[acyl-carrier-protein] thioesterase n=1 Tax=Oleidesulfovibrio sp. TaxID=2909707 RepID=UPI003A88CFA2